MGVALDSSFLLDLMRSLPAAQRRLALLEGAGEALSIPSPATYELLAGTMAERGRSEARRLDAFLSGFPTLPLDREAALRAAEVRAELIGIGRPKPHIDVLIAGIALRNSMSLLTADRDFDEIASATGLRVDHY
jgi:predicted nucleic acid-binding protein